MNTITFYKLNNKLKNTEVYSSDIIDFFTLEKKSYFDGIEEIDIVNGKKATDNDYSMEYIKNIAKEFDTIDKIFREHFASEGEDLLELSELIKNSNGYKEKIYSSLRFVGNNITVRQLRELLEEKEQKLYIISNKIKKVIEVPGDDRANLYNKKLSCLIARDKQIDELCNE